MVRNVNDYCSVIIVTDTLFDIAFPPRYSDDIKYFISFSDSPPTYVRLSKKSILKIFNKSKDVKNFINKNRLNLNEISSLIEIAKYVEKDY